MNHPFNIHSWICILQMGKSELSKIFEKLLTARLVDITLIELWRRGEIRRRLFSGLGQEAGPVVITSLMRDGDLLIPSYRGFAHVIGRGLSPELVLAEMLSKRSGILRGQGNPGSFTDPELGIYPNSDFLGSNLPFAVGMGLSLRRSGFGNIVTIFFGDGASTRSVFYGSLNLSALWSAPVLWVCENNQFSISTRFENTSLTPLLPKISAFGIRAIAVDGNDVLAIWRATNKMISYIRKNRKPGFIELQTYRIAGFEASDKDSYRERAEVLKWRLRDPLQLFERMASIICGQAALDSLKNLVIARVGKAALAARKSPEYTEAELLRLYQNYV